MIADKVNFQFAPNQRVHTDTLQRDWSIGNYSVSDAPSRAGEAPAVLRLEQQYLEFVGDSAHG